MRAALRESKLPERPQDREKKKRKERKDKQALLRAVSTEPKKFRELVREGNRSLGKETMYVNVHPSVADVLYGEEFVMLEMFEQRLNRRIVVRALQHLHPERYEVYAK